MKHLSNTLVLSLILLSCNVNTTYSNRESDKQEAEVITKQFYECLKKDQPAEAMGLFSSEFFSSTDTNKLYEFIDGDKKTEGNIESYLLADWQTSVVKGTDTRSDYLLMYVVRRQKKDTRETIALQKENGEIKIVGYKVDH